MILYFLCIEMSLLHPKHRKIPSVVIAHPLYQSVKSSSHYTERYDMWENAIILGLHIFEWIVVGGISLIVLMFTALFLDTFLS